MQRDVDQRHVDLLRGEGCHLSADGLDQGAGPPPLSHKEHLREFAVPGVEAAWMGIMVALNCIGTLADGGG